MYIIEFYGDLLTSFWFQVLITLGIGIRVVCSVSRIVILVIFIYNNDGLQLILTTQFTPCHVIPIHIHIHVANSKE